MNYKTAVVIDTDIGLRNLDVVMGLENRHCLQYGGCGGRKLPVKAGADPGQTLFQGCFFCHRPRRGIMVSVSPEQMIKLTDDLRRTFRLYPSGLPSRD